MKDKSFLILFGIYVIAFAADLISTLRLGELVQYLEANPLFKIGGLPLIILLNLVFMGIYYWLYSKGSISTRFITLFGMVAVIMTRLIAISQNIAVANDPPTIQQAMAVTQTMRTETVTRLVAVNIFPFFNGMFAWLFFYWDHNIKRKDEQKNTKIQEEDIESTKENKKTVL